jgi:hypothetical protein
MPSLPDEQARSQQLFSLSRFFKAVLERGTPTNFELATCNEFRRSLSSGWKSKSGEPTGYLVPSTTFDSPTGVVKNRLALLFAEGSNRVGRADKHFSVANRRDSKFNGIANHSGMEKLGFEISRVVGMQVGVAKGISLISPNNSVGGSIEEIVGVAPG